MKEVWHCIGLGAPGYLLPSLHACATWTRVHLLDVPGFGHRRTAGLPSDVPTSAGVVTAWTMQVATAPVVLLGHSTGAHPVRIPRGRHDGLCSQAWAEQLAATARDGEVRVLSGAHNVPWTRPHELSAAVASWAR